MCVVSEDASIDVPSYLEQGQVILEGGGVEDLYLVCTCTIMSSECV